MKYQGYREHNPANPPKVGILLSNLGTPDAPTPRALRRYLAEFLSDPRVVEYPRWLWQAILHGIILRIRPHRSAAAYRKIWTERGSPLLLHNQNLLAKVQTIIQQTHPNVLLALGMRYGNPSIAQALDSLYQANISQLIVLPLYPQYASATTGSIWDAVSHVLCRWRRVPEFHFISHYAEHPLYITALATHIQRYWQTSGQQNFLVFSFHGMPKRTALAGDPYYWQCQATARLVAEQLQLDDKAYTVVFQSRFGWEEWLQPYCDKTLAELPQRGIKAVDIICPGFAVDCLETLEEIAMLNKKIFTVAGGESYRYIPALNASSEHAQLLSALLQPYLTSHCLHRIDSYV